MTPIKPVEAKPILPLAPKVVPQTPVEDKSRHLQIVQEPGKTQERAIADVVAQGLASNAWTAMRFIKPEFGDVSLTDMVASLQASGEAINRNDTASAERMLYSQTVALNAIFGELARVSKANMFTNLDAMDRYMRLALKAQSQSRMTVETLATMKNPPVVFARQANFANGPQQVNNGGVTERSREGSRAGETQPAPSKLLEAHDVERLDPGAKGSTGGADPNLATVEAFNRAAGRGGQGRRLK